MSGSRAVLCASLLLATSALAAPERPPRVAVLVAGGNTYNTGSLQRILVEQFGSLEEFTVIPPSEIAARLAVPPPRPRLRDPAALAAETRLFEAAKGLYFRDRGAQALDQLSQLEKLLSQDPMAPTSDVVRLHIWRMAVLLAMNDKGQAETDALAGLTRDPALRLNPAEFPPSVQDTIADLRARRLRTVTVILAGLPAGARALVDERPGTGDRLEMPAGAHRLTVSAPGFRDVTEDFLAEADKSIQLSMPLWLGTALEPQLSSLLLQGTVSADDGPWLSGLFRRLSADRVLVAAPPESGLPARAMLISAPARLVTASTPADAGSPQQLTAWAVDRLLKTAPPRPRATPPPVRRRVATRSGWGVDLDAGVVGASRSQSTSGQGGRGLSGSFYGVGPALTGTLSRSALLARLELAWLDYGVTHDQVKLPTTPSPTTISVNGGGMLQSRLLAGGRIAFGAESASALEIVAGLSYDSYSAVDASGGGQNWGLFSSYTRTAPEAGLGVVLPLFIAGKASLFSAEALVEPAASFTESPTGNSGTNPSPGTGFAWEASLRTEASDKLDLRLRYFGAIRSVAFSGQAGSPLASPSGNPMTNATLSETIQGGGFSVAYHF